MSGHTTPSAEALAAEIKQRARNAASLRNDPDPRAMQIKELDRCVDELVALASSGQAASAVPELTDAQIDDLASEWVYIRSGTESEQYAELRQFARAVLAATPAAPAQPRDQELPGMWERADFIGGAADCEQPKVRVKFVPVDKSLRDSNWRHPNDDEPRTPACREALRLRGDDEGQGLDGYWKWGFAAGFNAALAEALSTPPAPRAPSIEPAHCDPLEDFQEGQWWVQELDKMAASLPTEPKHFDFKRAVAVVHHMLRSARASLAAPASAGVEEFPLPEARETAEPVNRGYTRTFNAIAAAVSWMPNRNFAISVESFWATYDAAPVSQAEPSKSHEEKGQG